MERLQQIVQRLARPIDYASRNERGKRPGVKNLGGYVSRQIVQALADQVYPSRIESDLLSLRQLFADFDERLEAGERVRRLEGAKMILRRLIDAGHGENAPSACQGDERQSGSPDSATPPSPPGTEISALPIQFARGVGPKRAVLLNRLGVRSVEDALFCLPWRYEDRSTITPIGELAPGQQATICGRVTNATLSRTRYRRMAVLDAAVQDSTGILHAIFFNQPYLERIFEPGVRVMLSGRVSAGRRGWTDLQLDGPHFEVLGEEDEPLLHVGRIVPIYHETKGLTSRQMRILIRGLLDHYAKDLHDLLPQPIRAKYRLPDIRDALCDVHFPPKDAERAALERGTTPAHRRLAFEELFLLELALAVRRRSVKEETKGIQFRINTPLAGRFRARLPFRLTPAQERVLSEIQRDMAASRPMNRLVQGDVGCGKTIVALHAMITACGSGYQAALMVPTEILADQHYLNTRTLLGKLGVNAVILKSGGSASARAAALKQIETGTAQIVIGTHAMIQKGVRFAKLGLAVIDEQHKFGVLQRKTLLDKGWHPDVLVLTATPIPRTLALTVYGDLDISIIDALPPGRSPIRTWLFVEGQRRRAYRMLHDEVRAGRQAYIVYPLVEESEKLDLQAAIQAAEELRAGQFSAYRVGLLHGRMKAEEKERTMTAFQRRKIDILVTTTVIEVGVDVRNATVMLIEHAARFGLAQLHQLRGRVGRGPQQSYCLLIASESGHAAESSATHARQRMEALVTSTDGFAIAEEDLRLRGPGEFFGVRQSGLPEFRAANLVRDGMLLEQARREAFALLKVDPRLEAPAHRPLRRALLKAWSAKLDLGSVN